MAQQTALETFWEQIAEILPFSVDSKTAMKLYEKFKEAKEMEKQQIEAAWKRGDGEHDKVADKLAKQYYTQTYGK
jgi:uncharacterized protein YhfF